MAHSKIFRTIYLNENLESRLQKQAKDEDSSVSRIARRALEMYLDHKETQDKENEFYKEIA